MKRISALLLSIPFLILFTACGGTPPKAPSGSIPVSTQNAVENITEPSAPQKSSSQLQESKLGYVTEGTEEYLGFVIDNVLHAKKPSVLLSWNGWFLLVMALPQPPANMKRVLITQSFRLRVRDPLNCLSCCPF